MNLWLVIVGMGLITFTIRLVLFVLSKRIELSKNMQMALQFVPPAVLAAIAVPEIVMPGGLLNLSLGNARLLAGLVAIGVAWKTENVMLTVLVGMVSLWILQVIV